ncbi:MAG: hypothetical protein KatS3mg111_2964 [Pirellulaceae bacterium]|nr:MAG: hypothetical protein KatS3mg111_2964 [Pirellulaceae bacterium]
MTATLASAFERLKKLPFPEFAESDELADWQADLSEFDGHVAGIATTILAGGKADLTTIPGHVDELRQRLQTMGDIAPEDREIMLQSKQYLNALEEVVQNLKQ